MGFADDLLTGIADSAIGSIGNVIGEGISSLFGLSSSQRYEKQLSQNAKYQKQMIDYTNTANLAYNKELTAWNNAENQKIAEENYNKYNSPTARMSAMKAAGVNPNLAIGAPSGFSPVTSSVSSGGASAPSGGSATQPYQSNKMSTLDMQLRRQEIDSVKLANGHQQEINIGLALDNRLKQLEIEKQEAEKPYWKQNAEQIAKSFMLGNTQTVAQIDSIRETINKTVAEINSMHIMDNKTVEEISNLIEQRKFIKASVDEKFAMIRKVSSDISVGQATVLLLGSQKGYYDAMQQLPAEQKKFITQQIANCKTADQLNKVALEIQKKYKDDYEFNAIHRITMDWLNAIANFIPTAGGSTNGQNYTPVTVNVQK